MNNAARMSKEELMETIKSCAERLGRAPTQGELASMHGMQKRVIRREFGTYTSALQACGLERADCCRPITMAALFRDWAGIVRRTGKIPTLAEYSMLGEYSYGPMLQRFSKWAWVARGMKEFAEKEGLATEWEDVLAKVSLYYEQPSVRRWDDLAQVQKLRQSSAMSSAHGSARGLELTAAGGIQFGAAWTVGKELPPLMTDRPSYGWPMVYSPMAHAPVNEMGVVYLFGAMAHELGFMVMRIQSEYPDCEAMRLMEGGRCQLVKIEFEWESVNFLRHLHDAKECDLIVCWKHNWKECPLEVIELSKCIGRSGDRVIGRSEQQFAADERR